jgi:hypothetical protein
MVLSRSNPQKGNIASSSTTPLQATTIVDITTAQQSNTAGIYKWRAAPPQLLPKKLLSQK